jgi:hypothetical protein
VTTRGLDFGLSKSVHLQICKSDSDPSSPPRPGLMKATKSARKGKLKVHCIVMRLGRSQPAPSGRHARNYQHSLGKVSKFHVP